MRTIEVLVSRQRARLRCLDPARLKDLWLLRLVVPGPQNTHRRSIDTDLAANGLQCERVLELDAMLSTLDFIDPVLTLGETSGVQQAFRIAGEARALVLV